VIKNQKKKFIKLTKKINKKYQKIQKKRPSDIKRHLLRRYQSFSYPRAGLFLALKKKVRSFEKVVNFFEKVVNFLKKW
jgi:hypothetical protein